MTAVSSNRHGLDKCAWSLICEASDGFPHGAGRAAIQPKPKHSKEMKTPAILLLTVLGLTASLASARGGRPGPGPGGRPGPSRELPAEVIAQYDTDGDGVLSGEEKAAMRAAIEAERDAKRAEFIAKWDADGDGVLNAAERAAAKAAMEAEKLAALTEKFNALDTDASGGISAEEWAAGAPEGADATKVAEAFDRKDADDDSSISLEEFTAKPARPAHRGGRR